MTPDEAETAGYHAWALGDAQAWRDAADAARAAQFDRVTLTARADALDDVAKRCVVSLTFARFWREVLKQP